MIVNIIDKARLFFRKDKELIASLYEILGFYPHHLDLYRVALSHKSVAFRKEENSRPLNNERLEFLGDAVLEAVVSDIVFHRYERKREGFLTNTRSKIVQRSSLNKLAEELGLDKLIRVNANTRAHNSYIGGNAFEALVGAVYLDRGYRYCQWFVGKRIIGSLLDIDRVARKEVNFKSKLLEWSQKNRLQTEFTLDDTENIDSNNPVFRSVVFIEGLKAGEGTGYSKKESQQQAAKEALARLRREPQFGSRIRSAKEKRTAMEASEFSVPPVIEDMEEKPAEKRKRGAGDSRHARRKPETRKVEAAVPADGAEQEEPKRKRARQPKKNAAEVQMPAAAETAPESGRKPRRRRAPKPEGEASAVQEPQNAGNSGREDIIRAAEEAAFNADNA